MLNGASRNLRTNSLMSEYAVLLGDAVLRQRARIAEQSARAEAEHAERIKSEFISNMSHELRTPLNTVIGFSKIISEHRNHGLNGEQITEYATLIHDAAVNLLAVINDILDVSKIQTGTCTLDKQEVDLQSVLDATVEAARNLGNARNINVEFRASGELPPVSGQANKLAQIFKGILSNAIKFTRPGGIVTVTAASEPDNTVAVTVRDTGVGMNAEELSVALRPFAQVDGSRSRWEEGTGLGLYIAKALTELHGGQLNIRSMKEVGTEVTVLLPSLRECVFAPGKSGGVVFSSNHSGMASSATSAER